MDRIREVADHLGVPFEQLYSTLVRQSYITGFVMLIGLIGCGSVAFYIITKVIPKLKEEDDMHESLFPLYMVVVILVFIGFLFLRTTLSALLNPTWFAIEKFI